MRSDYQQAYQLRLKGKSYGEIKRALGVPKSTLSSWFKNLELPTEVQKLLEEKGRVAREQLMEFNRRRTKAIQIENQEIRQEALDEIRSLSKYELLLVGAALYWGEGRKRWPQNDQRVQFVNSEPAMIVLFLRFLHEILQAPDEELRLVLRVHPNIDAESSVKFWSKITGIPSERFRITTQISRSSKKKRPRNSLPYGTLEIRVGISARQKFFQIKGWIDGLKNQSGLK